MTVRANSRLIFGMIEEVNIVPNPLIPFAVRMVLF